MASQRIYRAVIDDKIRLVRASHPSHVISHVSRSLIKVSIPTPDELVAAVQAGAIVEDINAQPEQLPLGD